MVRRLKEILSATSRI